MTIYFKIPKLEAGTSEMPPISMSPKEDLLDIEPHLNKIRASRSSEEAKLMNVLATLYSAAITTENISVSYLLLWQILESSASIKNAGGKLLSDDTLNDIRRLLQEGDYDAATVHRVKNLLGMLRGKGEVQVITEMLREYLFPDDSVDVLERKVGELRKIRGAITHPKPSERLDANKLLKNYKELRDIIDKLLQKLRYSEN